MSVYSVQLKDRKPVAGTTTCLTPPKFRQAMVSKDGEDAVLWNRGINDDAWSVWLAKTDGSELTRLTHDFRIAGFPFWTPDEKHIVFSGCRNLPASVKTFRDAMHRHKDIPSNLFMIDRDGNNVRQLTSGDYQDMRPCVSPDGHTVVFTSNRLGLSTRQLWKLDIASEKIELIDDHDGLNHRPIFSSDGKYLAYQSTKFQKHRENLLIREWPDGEEWNPIPLKEHEWIHGAFWISNDQRILFHGNLLGCKQSQLFILDLPSGKYECVRIPGLQSCVHGSIDQDETILLFDSNPNQSAGILKKLYRRTRYILSRLVN